MEKELCVDRTLDSFSRMVGGHVLFFVFSLFFQRLPACRGAYFAFRADHKARKEAHQFERWSNCTSICERCMAQRPTKNADPLMNYQDFRDDAARHMTRITHETYMATASVSPWCELEGFHLGTIAHDMMHTLYLGICRDIIASLVLDFSDEGVLGAGSMEKKLERFSIEMNNELKANRTALPVL